MRLLFLLFLLPISAFGQAPREVQVDCRSLFDFDPLSGRYVAGSMSQVADYVEQWRRQGEVSLTISTTNLLPAYRIYGQLVDSTLTARVLQYFAPFCLDSVSAPVDFSEMPRSHKFIEHFNSDIQHIKRFFATPLTMLEDTIKISDSYFGPSHFASLFHEFQLVTTKADVSFFAPPAPSGHLLPGVYIQDIYRLFHFDNNLTVILMTGRQIRDYIEKAYSKRYYRLRSENSDLVRWRTPYYLHISVANLSFSYNLVNARVQNFSLNLDQSYRVVANSFIISQIADNSSMVEDFGNYRLLLLRWLQNRSVSHCNILESWRLSPEKWVDAGIARENNVPSTF